VFQPRFTRLSQAQITLCYVEQGVSLSAIIPGYAGYVIVRATVAEAFRALADAFDEADARRAPPVGVA
jgi:hypothetical protein